ncbi:MAG: molecular chaperone DnaK (HSP70), partial [Bacteroidia bacterium]
SFSIKDGKIEVNPFAVPIGESTLSMVGYSKLDYSINYDGLLSIPKSLYKQNKANFNAYIPTTHIGRLDSFEWSDVEFDVSITGSYNNPKVKLDYKHTKKRVVDNVKSQVKSRIDDKKAAAKKEAEDRMNAAKRQAEEVKREAEERAKAAINEQRRKLEEQAQKEKETARKKIEEALKKKKQDLLKDRLPLPTK